MFYTHIGHEQDQARTRFQPSRFDALPEHHAGGKLQGAGTLSPSLLRASGCASSVNAPARGAVMQAAQRPNGNRAVQRAICGSATSSLASTRPVQRMSFRAPGEDLAHASQHLPGAVNVVVTPAAPSPIPIPY